MKGGRLLLGLLILAGAGLVAGALYRRGPAPEARPDVLLVIWDTCRADRLATFGHPRPTTPRLDALAAEGVRYTRCFTTAPWTAPSHGSLFTGLLPSVHGQTMVGHRVRRDVPVLAELLREAGYETVCFTANPLISDTTGLSRGFDTLVSFVDARAKVKDAGTGLAEVRKWLASRDRGKARRPLFLFVNFMDTHVPLEPPAEDVATVADPAVPAADVEAARKLDQIHIMGHLLGIRTIDEPTLAGMRVLYDGAVRYVDGRTGELVDLLRGEGFLEDGLTVVASDHGENLGDHGQTEHRASLYEPVMHVPLVVSRRGRYEGGRTVDSQVSLADLFPTILREAGVEPPPRPDSPPDSVNAGSAGRGVPGEFLARVLPRPGETPAERPVFAEQDSFLPIIAGQRERAFPDAPPSAFVPMRTALQVVREPESAPGARKLIRFLPFSEEGKPLPPRDEMYDTVADPGEVRDLLGADGDPSERVALERLARLLDKR